MRYGNSHGVSMSARFVLSILFALALCAGALAQDMPPPTDKKIEYSPYPQQDFPNRVFFGDTHLHTSYSTDAGMIGNRLGPEEAYRFARGETVTSSTGLPARLGRPLDFLVVADHAENLGLAPMIAESNPELLKSEWGRKVHDLVKAGKGFDAYDAWGAAMMARQDPLKGMPIMRTAWERITAAAEKYNEPGRFTAFIGYEWTSSPGGNNLHRNVIYRDAKDKADQVLPFSQYDSVDVEDLYELDGQLREEDRRPAAGHRAQRQSLQWAHVRRRHAHDQEAARPRLRAAALEVGAAVRSDPVEGYRRSASATLADRRVRELRDLGPGKLRSGAEDEGHAAPRVRARGIEARPRLRSQARRQSIQIRHDRLDRFPHLARHDRGEQLLRQDRHARALQRSDPIR